MSYTKNCLIDFLDYLDNNSPIEIMGVSVSWFDLWEQTDGKIMELPMLQEAWESFITEFAAQKGKQANEKNTRVRELISQ